MKKLIAFTLCFVFALSFCGCKTKSTFIETENGKVAVSIKEGTLTKEEVTLLIENKTSETGNFGYPFILEKQQNGNWFVINENQAFILPAIMLEANSTTEHKAVFENPLSKGKYRMIKNFYFDSGAVTTHLEFEIK